MKLRMRINDNGSHNVVQQVRDASESPAGYVGAFGAIYGSSTFGNGSKNPPSPDEINRRNREFYFTLLKPEEMDQNKGSSKKSPSPDQINAKNREFYALLLEPVEMRQMPGGSA